MRLVGSQRRRSIGWLEEKGGGERWCTPALSLGLCPGDTSHLKFKRAPPAGSRPSEVVKLKFKFPVEVGNKSGGKLGGQ